MILVNKRIGTGLLCVAMCAPLAVVLSSCMADEAPNSECDLLKVIVHAKDPKAVFAVLADTMKDVSPNVDRVSFGVKEGADLHSLSFDFKLTEGATLMDTLSMFGENTLDVRVLTKSEDTKYNRSYTLQFTPTKSFYTTLPTVVEYTFDDVTMYAEGGVNKYYEWTQKDWNAGKPDEFWSTGNAGYKLSKASAKPDQYPTVSIEKGYKGRGVQLVTLSTGSFGGMVGMPIAPGNLFIGDFDVTYALKDAMAATVFGKIFYLKPDRIEFMAKWKAGKTYKEKNGTVRTDKVDKPHVYAMFYKNTNEEGQPQRLHGDDATTSPINIAMALMTDTERDMLKEDEWTKITIPFVYTDEVSEKALEEGGYNLAVVFTSSADGGEFAGAVESVLTIDEVKIYCNEENTGKDIKK